MLQVYRFSSSEEGAKLLVLGAVHGNEIAGTKACEKLIAQINGGNINLLKGSLTLVPISNPKAYEQDIRQIEENLNRVIKSWENPQTYEQKLGVEVAKLIDDCDYMLDVHSTHNAGDVPFSFLDYPTEGNLNIIRALDVDYVLSGWPEVYRTQESIQDFSTETYAHAKAKNGVTLESGYHKDNAAIELAYKSIINLLKSLGMIEGEGESKEKKIIKMTSIVIKEKDGKFAQDFKHLDFVAQGTIITVCDDGQIVVAKKDCYIIIPNHDAKIGAEWYYLGE